MVFPQHALVTTSLARSSGLSATHTLGAGLDCCSTASTSEHFGKSKGAVCTYLCIPGRFVQAYLLSANTARPPRVTFQRRVASATTHQLQPTPNHLHHQAPSQCHKATEGNCTTFPADLTSPASITVLCSASWPWSRDAVTSYPPPTTTLRRDEEVLPRGPLVPCKYLGMYLPASPLGTLPVTPQEPTTALTVLPSNGISSQHAFSVSDLASVSSNALDRPGVSLPPTMLYQVYLPAFATLWPIVPATWVRKADVESILDQTVEESYREEEHIKAGYH
ncbi:hypothetical protein K456DRAFT_43351 [Colletotrichum gloeosporioides 23]|nr:hypothetical protein K456DRAFT_43351 [Colletotrichum gloeosporioides 23]